MHSSLAWTLGTAGLMCLGLRGGGSLSLSLVTASFSSSQRLLQRALVSRATDPRVPPLWPGCGVAPSHKGPGGGASCLSFIDQGLVLGDGWGGAGTYPELGTRDPLFLGCLH